MRKLSPVPSLIFLALFASCGTVVGNPKKPKDTPPPASVVYALPEVDFAVPADAADDDAALRLAEDETDLGQRGDKGLLKAWAKRLDGLLKQVNAATRRVNKVAESAKTSVDGDGVLRFSGKGQDSQLSGRIGKLPADSGFGYEAVICHAAAPWLHFKWTDGGERIELTRDFGAKTDAEDEPVTVLSRILVTKADGAVRLDVTTQGEITQDDGDGAGLTERTRAARLASGAIHVSTTVDRYASLPAPGAYEGDSYLVGRLVPKTGSGKFDAEFVGYTKQLPVLCGAGFDESAEDLWNPDRQGPRFCLGRPLGASKFKTLVQFRETAKSLEAVGLVPKADLAPVAFEPSVNCGAL